MSRYVFDDLSDEQISKLKIAVWYKVDIRGEDDCWLWTGGSSANRLLPRYGSVGLPMAQKNVLAHRAAYFLHTNIDPGPSVIMHKCDTTLCCNPRHLEMGTQADNVRDMMLKGRGGGAILTSKVGSNNPFSKLTEEDVVVIRNRLRMGQSCGEIAFDFPVHRITISDINRGITWTHVS